MRARFVPLAPKPLAFGYQGRAHRKVVPHPGPDCQRDRDSGLVRIARESLCVAHEDVAVRSVQQDRRQMVHLSEERGDARVTRIMADDVMLFRRILRLEAQWVDADAPAHRVSGLLQVHDGTQACEPRGQRIPRVPQLLQTGQSQPAPRGVAGKCYARGVDSLAEEPSVGRHRVIQRRWEPVLRCEAVVDEQDADAGLVREMRDERAIGVHEPECIASAMQVEDGTIICCSGGNVPFARYGVGPDRGAVQACWQLRGRQALHIPAELLDGLVEVDEKAHGSAQDLASDAQHGRMIGGPPAPDNGGIRALRSPVRQTASWALPRAPCCSPK